MIRDLVLRSRRLLTGDGLGEGALVIDGGRIEAITAVTAAPAAREVVDVGSLVVMPGLVDSHVHVNDPGRADWEGFDSATCAAMCGGVTTLIDMPLNSIPPTTTADHLEQKRRAAAGRLAVDVGFWGGVVPGNLGELESMADAGVLGFKCFLCASGVDEFPHIVADDLEAALSGLARIGAVLLVHAEDPVILGNAQPTRGTESRWYRSYLATRPDEAELESIRLLIRLARKTGGRVHIVHLSTARALGEIAEARRSGVRVSVETCPHYLHFAAEDVPDGATEFKCAPPIRSRENRELLWQGLVTGEIDLVASDHSPSPPELKCRDSGDFLNAWGGISSLPLTLPVVWTGARSRGVALEALPRWLAEGPARLAGLADRKGHLRVGADADLVVWDPDVAAIVHPETRHTRHALTPYAGQTLYGRVEMTILRGQLVYRRPDLLRLDAGMLLESTRVRLH